MNQTSTDTSSADFFLGNPQFTMSLISTWAGMGVLTLGYYGSKALKLSTFRYIKKLQASNAQKELKAPFKIDIGENKAIFTLVDLTFQNSFIGFQFQSKIKSLKVRLIPQQKGLDNIILDLDEIGRTSEQVLVPGVSYRCQFSLGEKFALSDSWLDYSKDPFIRILELPYYLRTTPSLDVLNSLRLELSGVHPRNIAVFGKVGNGKSSFINSIFFTLTGEWRQIARPSFANLSVTDRMTAYDIPQSSLKLFDFPGFEEGYDFKLIPQILKGRCGRITREQMRSGEIVLGPEDASNRIDGVIFILGANSIKADEPVNTQILNQLIDSGIPFICIAAKIEMIIGGPESSIKKEGFYTDPRVIEKCRKIKDTFDGHVFPMINYRHDNQLEPSVDLVTLTALKTLTNLSL